MASLNDTLTMESGQIDAPDTLMLMCIKSIVTRNISLAQYKLPREIGHLLMRVYRDYWRTKNCPTGDQTSTSHEQCEAFLRQFHPDNIPLTHVDFSDMPITDEFLASFLDQYKQFLIHLNISNCNQLTSSTLSSINRLFTRRHNSITSTTFTTAAETTESPMSITDDDEDDSDDGENNDKDAVPLRHRRRRLKHENKHDEVPDQHNQQQHEEHKISRLETSTATTTSDNNRPTTISGSSTLKTLILGDTISGMLLPVKLTWSANKIIRHSQGAIFRDGVELRKLVVHDYKAHDCSSENCDVSLDNLIAPSMTTTLQYLDLSNSCIGQGRHLSRLQCLRALILYDCKTVKPYIYENIAKISTLKVLDISQVSSDQSDETDKCHRKYLRLLVERLPQLVSLDISGTQLVCRKHWDIAGLKSRQLRPLEFLGLFHTGEDASYRSNIPALTIAGDANESQILTACEVYMHRSKQLSRALNDLFNCFRIRDEFDDIERALNIVLTAMKLYLQDQQVQCTATASLFYIARSQEASREFGSHTKRLILKRLLDTMLCHKDSKMVLRNGMLIMVNTHMLILTYEFLRVSLITMHVINANFDDDGFMQRVAVFLLNSIACQVGGNQKVIIGTAGAIETMIKLIRSRLRARQCDDTLETAWSTMWNITDETPVNCMRFLKNDGLRLFTMCMQEFSDRTDLLRNIMGLLGNVAECADLRHKFMDELYITRFVNLLGSDIDGVECSYNACGILAHIMYDGPEFWNQHLSPESREQCLRSMNRAISSWTINVERNINYRSFVPIVRLLDVHVTSEAQYWAVWALTNLTRVYPQKYCSLLVDDNGHTALERLVEHQDTVDYVRELARITLYQMKRFNEEKSLCGLERCKSVVYDEVVNFRLDNNTNANSNKNRSATATVISSP